MYLKTFYLYIALVLLTASINAFAQVIDNTSTFKTITSKSYFRFQYDNDFFTKEDRYYTQGIGFEYVHPGLRAFPVNRLLLKPANSSIVYGLAFNIFGYTPTSILSDSILYGDRPYAAAISIKTFAAATDTVHKKRIASSINIGVIGPAGLGNEIQTNIHRWLNNPLPKGWHTQIQNDIILNYQVNYEKQLSATDKFLLNAAAELRVGTLDNRFSGGFNFMTGNFNDPYHPTVYRKKKIEYYFYGQGRAHVVGYDASLQGGLFNRKNPYIIPLKDIERFKFQADAGIVVNFKKLYLSYSQSFITKEFKTGKLHRWGGFNIGFNF